MIVSFNFYYAQPGLEAAVLRQRLRACDVRERLAIPRGRVLARISGTPDLPDVIWEQRFESVAEHLADMDVRAASTEFESIRTGMRRLYRRFERPLFEICGSASSVVDVPPLSRSTVTLDWIFCGAADTHHLVELLLQHTAHDETSHPTGTRLLRLITPGNDLPELVWQRDCANTERKAAQAILDGRSGRTPGAVAAPARRVEHSVWSVA